MKPKAYLNGQEIPFAGWNKPEYMKEGDVFELRTPFIRRDKPKRFVQVFTAAESVVKYDHK